jgi:hypothetical protein
MIPTCRLLAALTIVAAVPACTGEAGLEGSQGDSKVTPYTPPGGDPFAPCTELSKCCAPEEIVCVADPDKGDQTCTCGGLWDCSQNPKKCEQSNQVPPGGGTWTCVWTAQAYTCTGNPSSPPPGGNGWSCKLAGGQWVCTKSPPNPSNKPEGTSVWKCTVNNELGKTQCERITPPDAAPPPPPKADAGVPKPDVALPKPDTKPPPPKTETNCADGIDNDGDGLVDCKDSDCPACTPTPCPAGKECCDGIDNDGDGQIDEGNVCAPIGNGPCPPGAYQACDCYCGVHRRCKADGTWGPCKVDGSCQLAKITSQSQCGFAQYCDFGNCVFGFVAGQCKHHTDCPSPLICDLGECVPDNYFPCP